MSGWAALAKVGGDLASSALGLYSSSKAWRRQREAAQNAHQWEVEDLRKAGLNPILSATGGSGASAGSASVPAGLGVDLGAAYNSVNAQDLLKEQINTQRDQQWLLKQQAAKADADAALADQQRDVLLTTNAPQKVLNNWINENPSEAKSLMAHKFRNDTTGSWWSIPKFILDNKRSFDNAHPR